MGCSDPSFLSGEQLIERIKCLDAAGMV